MESVPTPTIPDQTSRIPCENQGHMCTQAFLSNCFTECLTTENRAHYNDSRQKFGMRIENNAKYQAETMKDFADKFEENLNISMDMNSDIFVL